jgi:hypothetical protein
VAGTVSGGGFYNQTEDIDLRNKVTDHGGAVGGGFSNQAGDDNPDPTSAFGSTVAGGGRNTASGAASTIGGGQSNEASGPGSTVSGGSSNDATASSATVDGGRNNEASGEAATVVGGDGNIAEGNYSFAAGRRAKTGANQGAFVWGGAKGTDVTATAAEEVRFRAAGGFAVQDGDVTVEDSNNLSVTGDTTVDGTATMNGSASVSSDLTVGGTIKRDAITRGDLDSGASSIPTGQETVLGFSSALDEPNAFNDLQHQCDIPADGHYEITLNIQFLNPFSGNSGVKPAVRIEGSISYEWETTAVAGGSYERSFSTTLLDQTTGSVMDFTLFQDSGSSKDLYFGRKGTRVTIRYLGDGTS